MKPAIVLLFVCGTICSTSMASNYFVSGSKLAGWLAAEDRLSRGSKNLDDLTDAWEARAFLDGVVDTLEEHSMLCNSNGLTAAQLRAVANKYLNEHPENWNGPAANLVESALRQAFPCLR